MVPDCLDSKKSVATDKKYGFDLRTRSKVKLSQEYEDPRPHRYRDEAEIQPGMADFMLRSKPVVIDNPHGLSSLKELPRQLTDHQIKNHRYQNLARGGSQKRPWQKYISLNARNVDMSQHFKDKHNMIFPGRKEKTPFLAKDQFVPAYLELARTMKDDFVYGKPKLNLYNKGLKPENVNSQFDGKFAPMRVIK